MLIDQFTPQQIAQIRRELREIQKMSKIGNNEKMWAEVNKLFDHKSYSDECLFPYRAVTDAISAICDFTFDNFVYKNTGRTKKQVGWYRSPTLPLGKEALYENMQQELLKVIEKYRMNSKFPLKKE